jgi:hypothetical protein
MDHLKELYAQAAELLGREVEVVPTTDGKYIALFLRFDRSPPRKGHTEEEALRFFVEDLRAFKATEQAALEAKLDADEAKLIESGVIEVP